jgi:exo-beta-1,3-glucanase (GH17 family)
MRFPFGLCALVTCAIVAAWWWLGAPVEIPPSPLQQGEKLHCVSYTPFRRHQTPLDLSTRVDPRQIEDDFAKLAGLTECVRTYSTNLGLDRVAEIAERYGLKVMQGLWLGRDPARNRREIETAIALANRYPNVISSVVVGNEVLLRGELAPGDLVNIIRAVKTRVSVPVTYADVWEFWLRFPAGADVVDFLTVHTLPYWEDFPISATDAASHVESIREKIAAAYPGRRILIGEIGWPSAGRMREGALPSPANQSRVISDVLARAKRGNYRVNVMEAFDQPWKEALEGAVGGHWGVLDADTGRLKFSGGTPVSNHPHWQLQAAAGVALAAVVFGAGLAARRRAWAANAPMRMAWIGVAVMALIPGICAGWAVENVPIESMGLGGWARSLVMAGLALAAPAAAAAALMHKTAVPGFALLLGPSKQRPRDRLALLLGSLFIAVTVIALQVALGLVFDPRYRDFPFAPLTAAALPFLVIGLIGHRSQGRRGLAETTSASLLGGTAIYIALNEGFANWQALWLCAVFVGLAFTLMRARDVQS